MVWEVLTMGKIVRDPRMQQVLKLVRPGVVREIQIVTASETSWMANVVMADGNDRRFRFQGRLYNETSIGDCRIS